MACAGNESDYLASDSGAWNTATLVLVLITGVILIVFAAASNCFVVYAIATKRSLRKRSNALYVSLAVADILVATCVMTLALANDLLHQWIFGDFMCRFWIALDVMCCTASILSIAAVSFDRYLHISDPFMYERLVTKRLMFAVICAIWILSAVISFIPIGFGFHERTQSQSDNANADANHNQSALVCKANASDTPYQCKFEINVAYAVGSSLISFYLPCLTVLILYGKLYRIARYHYSKISHAMLAQHLVSKTVVAMGAFAPALQPNMRKKSLSTTALNNGTSLPTESFHEQLQAEHKYKKLFKERKAAITLGLIISTFLVTWTPYFIVNIIGAFDDSLIPGHLFVAVTYMGYMNSCIDPIVYVVFQADFRIALRSSIARLRELLRRHLCRSKLHTAERRAACAANQPCGTLQLPFHTRPSAYDAEPDLEDLSLSVGIHSQRRSRRKSKSFLNLYFSETSNNV